MENASKALIMAASVLIGIMILTLAAYLFTSFSGRAREVEQQLADDQLNKFNSQFTTYEGKAGITIYDVISVAQLATSINKANELSKNDDSNDTSSYYVKVKLENSYIEYGTENNNNDEIQKNYTEIIKNELEQMSVGKLPNYNCSVSYNSITGRVNEVIFTKQKT